MVHCYCVYDLQGKGYFRRGSVTAVGPQALQYGLVAHAQDMRGHGQSRQTLGLKSEIDFDEGCFYIATKDREKKKLKRGRGRQRQSNVAVMCCCHDGINIFEGSRYGQEEQPLPVFQDEGAHIAQIGGDQPRGPENFDKRSIVFSDKSTIYVNISDYVEMYIMEKLRKETKATTLEWVHIANANTKKMLLGLQ